MPAHSPLAPWMRTVLLVSALLASKPVLAQQNWSQVATSAAPTGRYGFGMAYDPVRRQTVVFGGETGSTDFTGVADTWVFDGSNWTQRSPATSPPARGETAMVWDSARQQIVLFGGIAPNGTKLNDTWVWDGTAWTQKAPATLPPVRGYHALAYDAAHQQVVLYAGSGTNTILNDTWVWDGVNWAQKSPATSPTQRLYPNIVYDGARQKVLLFGGMVSGALASDTWLWDGSNWTQAAPANQPIPSDTTSLSYDPISQRVLLFGGIALVNGTVSFLTTTWSWDGTNWTQLAPAAQPPGRSQAGLVYDAARQQFVLFGGANTAYLNDTWAFGGTSLNWVQQAPPLSPPARGFSAMAYDAKRQQAVMFGGASNVQAHLYLGDTWVWDGAAWAQKSPANQPGVRELHAMAYDAARQQVVLFGGLDNLGYLSDTWVWDGINWTQKFPATVPPVRAFHSLAYDEVHQQVILSGGSAFGSFLNDTWVWDGSNWTQKNPATSPPYFSTYLAMAFDSARQKTVRYLTTYSGSLGWNSQTWTWDGVNWAQSAPPNSPEARILDASIVYMNGLQQTLLFGGSNATTNTLIADTWLWGGTDWTQLYPLVSPSPRLGYAMAFDTLNQRAVLFGGQGPNNVYYSDTWLFGGASTFPVNITVPAGVQFTFNGVTYTGSQLINAAPGTYTLSATSPQQSGGSQFLFTSWSDAGAISHPVTVASAPVNITGAFKTQYLLTAAASPSNGGTVSQTAASSNGPYYGPGTLVSVFQTPSPGFTFTGWSGACSGTGACFVTMNAPAAVTANFTRPTYSVAIHVPAGVQYSFGGLPLTGPASLTLPAGSYDIVMTSPQAAGAGTQLAFVSWSDLGAVSHTLTVSGPTTLTGTFKTQYLLTTAASPANEGAVTPGGYLDAGSSIILTATPNANYAFAYWSGACSGANPLCFLVISAPLSATANFNTPYHWTPVFPATQPAAIGSAPAVFDAARQQVVLFGGQSGNETWIWDGALWTRKLPATVPGSQINEMAYDAKRGKVVLLGISGAYPNDKSTIWEWDGANWTLIPAAAPPEPRAGPNLFYDETLQKVVLFGGEGHFGAPVYQKGLNDAWTWDGAVWTPLATPVAPGPRAGACGAYDSANHQLVLFGGFDAVTAVNYSDTWVWNGASWTQKSPVTSPPSFSCDSNVAYHSQLRQIMIVGWNNTTSWFWDGTNWSSHQFPVQPPGALSVSYDPARQQLVVLGQSSLPLKPVLSETWLFNNTLNPPLYQLTASVTPPGSGTLAVKASGQPGPSYVAGSPLLVTPTPAAGYGLKSWSGDCSGSGLCLVTLDTNRSVTANFSNAPVNVTVNVPAGIQFTLNGVTYTGTQAVVLTPGSYSLSIATVQTLSPGSRAVFLSWSDGLPSTHPLIVGGNPVSITASFQQMYQLTLAAAPPAGGTITAAGGPYYNTGSVVPVTATPAAGYIFSNWSGACSGPAACSVTMNAPATVTANFAAGAHPLTINVPAGVPYTLFGFPFVGPQTISLPPGSYPLSVNPAQSTGPGARLAFLSWSDGGAASHNVVLGAAPLTVTGVFSTQYLLSSSAAPANQGSVGTAGGPWFDAGTTVTASALASPGYEFEYWSGACTGSAVFCFVKMNAPATLVGHFSVPVVASQLHPAAHPSARNGYGLAYDAGNQQVVLFGGTEQGTNKLLNDTWLWDGFSWALQSPALSPPPRSLMGMAYHAGTGTVVMFGGETPGPLATPNHFGDTWVWNGKTKTWTQKGAGPSPRFDSAMSSFGSDVILFGGVFAQTAAFVVVDGTAYGDTWLWDGNAWHQKAPVHSPSPRFASSIAYDSVRNQAVLIAGILPLSKSNSAYTDTWAWNGSDWQAVSTTTPSGFAAAFDPTIQQVILLSVSGNYLWAWDGAAWYQRETHDPTLNNLVFDAARQELVAFGNAGATWIRVAPKVSLAAGGAPSVAIAANGDYLVTVNMKNQGNIPETGILATAATASGISASGFTSAQLFTLDPGQGAPVTARFPKSAGTGFKVLTLSGLYSAPPVANSASWSTSLLVNFP